MGFRDLFKKTGGDKGHAVDPALIQSLIDKLSDRDWKVRFEACKALAVLGPAAEAAVPRLHELIDDDNGDVCNAAAQALSVVERD